MPFSWKYLLEPYFQCWTQKLNIHHCSHAKHWFTHIWKTMQKNFKECDKYVCTAMRHQKRITSVKNDSLPKEWEKVVLFLNSQTYKCRENSQDWYEIQQRLVITTVQKDGTLSPERGDDCVHVHVCVLQGCIYVVIGFHCADLGNRSRKQRWLQPQSQRRDWKFSEEVFSISQLEWAEWLTQVLHTGVNLYLSGEPWKHDFLSGQKKKKGNLEP